ncbi:MAG: DUF5668 domain-containing protein [Ferruginibacter sp.]
MEKNKKFGEGEGGRVIGGLILVAIGAALLLRNMGFFMPVWIFKWPMILIVIGIFIGFKSNFRNNAWFILIAVGGYFLINEFIPELGLRPMFWPIMIIVLGVAFILRPGRNKWVDMKNDPNDNKWENLPGTTKDYLTGSPSLDSSDYLIIRSVFSGVNKMVVSKNFQGGRISCVFGGAEIDLSQADINGQVMIKLEMVFGGAKLVVPPHWTIQNNIDGAFHAVDDKRSFNPSATINPDKVLILKGSAVFGGIEIRSY